MLDPTLVARIPMLMFAKLALKTSLVRSNSAKESLVNLVTPANARLPSNTSRPSTRVLKERSARCVS